jgi:hypothetical protein
MVVLEFAPRSRKGAFSLALPTFECPPPLDSSGWDSKKVFISHECDHVNRVWGFGPLQKLDSKNSLALATASL